LCDNILPYRDMRPSNL